jgi:hypothetical protein
MEGITIVHFQFWVALLFECNRYSVIQYWLRYPLGIACGTCTAGVVHILAVAL